ncbi:protein FAR-RED ELONGATED HYPOCOTYL 3-like [Abrus precatorius]|uniref:Protein FAR1-RELATED SEQUENCE n=1 Tax=Abrus precatorius TaxID=3816 RepID=A0A8B8M1M5_ABRPR|nr:protein FAR-RED ELONGATED HYPOCOTYL 3-like [Abrus precatorius]
MEVQKFIAEEPHKHDNENVEPVCEVTSEDDSCDSSDIVEPSVGMEFDDVEAIKSQAAYESFGDIVSFDTTYLTNKYDMPFAAFVGVNHHGQCICGKAPNGIVTDQCKAMQNAIAIVLPNTRHRCLTKDDFEEKWYSLLKKFDVEQNQWLCRLFKDQHKWVPIYLKQDFWVGLSTTQRSKSVHAFCDGYLNSKTSLQQFMKQYDNALRSKVEKEVETDFRTMNITIQCGSNSLIERQFQVEYTNAKFAEVQAEFRGKMNRATAIKFEVRTIISYNMCEDFIFGNQMKEAKFEVIFNRESKDISCQCLLFEFRGIMCKHSLSVLEIERVKQVPSKYILNRWSKNIKRRHPYIKASYDKIELKPMKERYDNLCKHFYNVAEIVANFEEASNHLHTTLHNFTSNLPTICSSLNKHSNDEDIAYNLGEECPIQMNTIHSSTCVACKGRPTTKRKVSKCEKVVRKYNKKCMKSSANLLIEESLGGTVAKQCKSNLCIQSSIKVQMNESVEVSMFEEIILGSQSSIL